MNYLVKNLKSLSKIKKGPIKLTNHLLYFRLNQQSLYKTRLFLLLSYTPRRKAKVINKTLYSQFYRLTLQKNPLSFPILRRSRWWPIYGKLWLSQKGAVSLVIKFKLIMEAKLHEMLLIIYPTDGSNLIPIEKVGYVLKKLGFDYLT